MSVHIYEARAEHQAGGIEHFPCGLSRKAWFDHRDLAVRDAHFGSKRGAVAGEDQGSFDQKVKRHCLTPYDQPQPSVVEAHNIQLTPTRNCCRRTGLWFPMHPAGLWCDAQAYLARSLSMARASSTSSPTVSRSA